jgi:hypothetical protein
MGLFRALNPFCLNVTAPRHRTARALEQIARADREERAVGQTLRSPVSELQFPVRRSGMTLVRRRASRRRTSPRPGKGGLEERPALSRAPKSSSRVANQRQRGYRSWPTSRSNALIRLRCSRGTRLVSLRRANSIQDLRQFSPGRSHQCCSFRARPLCAEFDTQLSGRDPEGRAQLAAGVGPQS